MKGINKEIKAGAVIVAAILFALLFFLKTTTIYTSTYDVKTYFRFAGDIKDDATVKLSGIEVGRVKDIKLVYDPETMVECVLEVDKGAKLRKDSIAYISTTGLVGDAFVGLTPGTAGEFIKHGSTIASEDPIQMRLLMKRADNIAKNLDKTLTAVKSIVTDNKQNIDNIVLNLEATTENFEEFSAEIKKNPWKLLFKPSK
ncbi:MAG: MlaD family protein [Candidatus Omnitrophota bacterium]|jgi:phospholipid/cholesterol/gamma-HCH transport system substrate-binding protein